MRPDFAAVERAASGRALRLPRVPHRGRLGDVRASSVGASLELHDFRQYAPGDDLRHVDWNAVARTGELYLRVRQDEVSPRVEVLLDGSASMAVSEEKASRAVELAAWVVTLASRAGLDATLTVTGAQVRRVPAASTRALLEVVDFSGREPFDVALRRGPPLSACGLRVVVSDFLFEATPQSLAERLARDAAGLMLVQDAEDAAPSGGAGVRLVDAESGEALERVLTPAVLERYAARLHAHQASWEAAARRVRGAWAQALADRPLEVLARSELAGLVARP